LEFIFIIINGIDSEVVGKEAFLERSNEEDLSAEQTER